MQPRWSVRRYVDPDAARLSTLSENWRVTTRDEKLCFHLECTFKARVRLHWGQLRWRIANYTQFILCWPCRVHHRQLESGSPPVFHRNVLVKVVHLTVQAAQACIYYYYYYYYYYYGFTEAQTIGNEWNSLPVINLSLSTSTIKNMLKNFLWTHFINSFDSSSTCTWFFCCPCNQCTTSNTSSNFASFSSQ